MAGDRVSVRKMRSVGFVRGRASIPKQVACAVACLAWPDGKALRDCIFFQIAHERVVTYVELQ